jgi:hypothetical protein
MAKKGKAKGRKRKVADLTARDARAVKGGLMAGRSGQDARYRAGGERDPS